MSFCRRPEFHTATAPAHEPHPLPHSHLITVNKPVFITGPTGAGKSSLVASLFKKLEPRPDEGTGGLNALGVFVNYSAQTSSLVTQLTIEGKLEKKRKTLLGGPAGKVRSPCSAAATRRRPREKTPLTQ